MCKKEISVSEEDIWEIENGVCRLKSFGGTGDISSYRKGGVFFPNHHRIQISQNPPKDIFYFSLPPIFHKASNSFSLSRTSASVFRWGETLFDPAGVGGGEIRFRSLTLTLLDRIWDHGKKMQ